MPGRGTVPGRAEAGMCLECSWIAKETGQPEEGRKGLGTQADDRQSLRGCDTHHGRSFQAEGNGSRLLILTRRLI